MIHLVRNTHASIHRCGKTGAPIIWLDSEIERWLEANARGSWTTGVASRIRAARDDYEKVRVGSDRVTVRHPTISFEDERDELLFKMFWL